MTLKPRTYHGGNVATKRFVAVVLSFVLASVVNVYPLEVSHAVFRPLAFMMVLAFWVIHLPRYVGVGIALIIGLIADLFMDTRLGQQAFSAVIMTFVLELMIGYVKQLDALKAWGLASVGLVVFQITLWLVQYITQNIFIGSSVWSLAVSIASWGLLYFALIRFVR